MIMQETQITIPFIHSIIHSSSIYFESTVGQLLFYVVGIQETQYKQLCSPDRDNLLEKQTENKGINIMSHCNKCHKASQGMGIDNDRGATDNSEILFMTNFYLWFFIFLDVKLS